MLTELVTYFPYAWPVLRFVRRRRRRQEQAGVVDKNEMIRIRLVDDPQLIDHRALI
jgi:hypothetical protein